ncbi:hypothetical protein [Helicobacter sp. NHP22-001]|uniref:hypothetical protein n=1 Tax=Helicobacter sp. NHP22-001 TaxID=3040202 RepID=UPI00244D946D|nr:hypothetical protein [Helicobacter sp. NHP22-001]GMB95680.1 hypothetical protein NHP22001_02690 [Helicobacter sp. NHP22-001]
MVSKKLVLLGLAGALALAGCDKAKEDHNSKKEESHKEAPKTDMKKEGADKPGVKKEEGKPTSQVAKPEEGQVVTKAEAITDQDVAKVAKSALEDMLKDPKVQKIKEHNIFVVEAKNSIKGKIDTAKLTHIEEAVLKEQKKFVVIEPHAKNAKTAGLMLSTHLEQNTTKAGVAVLVLHLMDAKNGSAIWKKELPITHAESQAKAGIKS